MGVGMETRGRSHANAAVTIRPGASKPLGGRSWNKALAFSTCEKPAFLGPEAARAQPPLSPFTLRTTQSASRAKCSKVRFSFSFDPGDAYEM